MKTRLVSLLVAVVCLLSFTMSNAQDQCDTTQECKNMFGNSATDCLNSRSDNSICMCGNSPCEGGNNGSRFIIPGIIEAEDYTNFFDTTPGNRGGHYRNDDVDIGRTSDSGGGYKVGYIAGNEWLEYRVNVNESGNYRAEARVTSALSSGMFTLEINGQTVGNAFDVPNTGGWNNFRTISRDIGYLSRGNKVLRIQVQSGGFDINFLDIKRDVGTPTVDQCDTTQECKAQYGDRATDCLNSRSDRSVCMCGSVACDEDDGGGNNGGGMLGRFERGKDLLLSNFDLKPDPDDVHSVAALGTMLLDPRFNNVDYHATMGTVGRQGGSFINASNLFNMAFGNRWSNAASNWNGAVRTAADKAIAALRDGGDVWVQEAGQSDFTADVLRRVKNAMPSLDTRSRFHVVQHSQWNEDQTTGSDLSYVKNNSNYRKIADGNSSGNGTPDYSTRDGSNWSRATSHPNAGRLWREARNLARDKNDDPGHYENPNIGAGGFDFSDTVEATWIFGFNGTSNVTAFFNQFL